MELEIIPVAGRIGAEIRGVDLSRPLDDPTVAAVWGALLRHKVIFFRDQEIDDTDQETLAERLGNPIKHPLAPAAAGSRFLLELDAAEGYAASRWHTDMTFLPAFPAASILRPLELPSVGGDTIWANTAAAYQNLPEPLRILADSLKALHINTFDYAAQFGAESEERFAKYRGMGGVPTVFETEHPVVAVHPETGERTLVLGAFFKRFSALNSEDSLRLFTLLQEHITRPENSVRWRWRLGDLAIWDNRATQHRAVADFGDERRRLRRATIHGVTTVGADGVASRQLKPEPELQAAE